MKVNLLAITAIVSLQGIQARERLELEYDLEGAEQDLEADASVYASSRRGKPILIKKVNSHEKAPASSKLRGHRKLYSVPDLPYPFDALEPYLDAPTMTIHHDKHHATYVANINKATEGTDEIPILDLQAEALESGPAVRNNGGGHYNHAFFWTLMAPHDKAKDTKPSAQLQELIDKSFGSLEEMKARFEARAAPGAVFGSGWVWIVVNKEGDELSIEGTPNQDNPLMKGVLDEVAFPILGLDVWEHGYYLKYQNRRPEYVSNWWNVVNWDKVSEYCAYVVENHKGVSV